MQDFFRRDNQAKKLENPRGGIWQKTRKMLSEKKTKRALLLDKMALLCYNEVPTKKGVFIS